MGKGKYGGKYQRLTEPESSGYYGTDIAGQRKEIGQGSRRYTFYSDTKGTLTIWASSFDEAWRQAKERGYKRRRYKKR